MDPGVRTPLIDYFLRGEVERDVRRLAARGSLAPAALESWRSWLCFWMTGTWRFRRSQLTRSRRFPRSRWRLFSRGPRSRRYCETSSRREIEPAVTPAPEANEPLIDHEPEVPAEVNQQEQRPKALSLLPVVERMKLAMRGTCEQRGQLIGDANRMISVAVLSSPKLTETEVESYARMANVSDEHCVASARLGTGPRATASPRH